MKHPVQITIFLVKGFYSSYTPYTPYESGLLPTNNY